MKVNAWSTERTLDVALEKRARFFFASTSEVYGDPKQRRPDITKAKQLLGWEPKVSLEEGLRSTITYFQGRLDQLK